MIKDLQNQFKKEETAKQESREHISDATNNPQTNQHTVSLDKELIQMEISDYIDDTV